MNARWKFIRVAAIASTVAGIAGCSNGGPAGASSHAGSQGATEPNPPASAMSHAESDDALRPGTVQRITDASLVCMVNDAYMGRPQIPVRVGDRTYYGCCAMCERRLSDDPAVRRATDPLTGAEVDKATAVLARTDSDAILYFETVESFSRYAHRESP